MIRHGKRITSLLLALLMIATILAGCGGTAPAATDTSSAAPASSAAETVESTTAEASASAAAPEPVTFSYLMVGPASAWSPEKLSNTKIGQIIQADTGVDLEFEYLVGDQDTKVGVLTASGDYPDIICGAGGSTKNFVNAKAFVPLDEYLDSTPTLNALYKDVWKRNLDPGDGKLYFIPFGAPMGGKDPKVTLSGGYFYTIQKRVLKEMNWPQIKTVDQMFEVLKAYKEKNPQTDGQDTIAFTFYKDGWRDNFTWAYETSSGFKNNLIYDAMAVVDNGTKKIASIKPKSEGFKRMLQIANKAYNEGLIDKESFVQKYDQYVGKLATGRVLATIDADWDYGSAVSSLLQANQEDRTFFQMALPFDEGTPMQPQIPWIPSGEGVGISVAAKDPARIMQFFEYMSTEKAMKLCTWGIEGEDYTVDANGRFVRTKEQNDRAESNAEYKKAQGLGGVFHYGFPYGQGVYSDGNADSPNKQLEVVKAGFTASDNEFLTAYGLNVPADMLNLETLLVKWSPLWTMNLGDGTPARVVSTQIGELDDKYRPKIIMGSVADFDKNYQEFMDALDKLDLQSYIDAVQTEIDNREANW